MTQQNSPTLLYASVRRDLTGHLMKYPHFSGRLIFIAKICTQLPDPVPILFHRIGLTYSISFCCERECWILTECKQGDIKVWNYYLTRDLPKTIKHKHSRKDFLLYLYFLIKFWKLLSTEFYVNYSQQLLETSFLYHWNK